MCPEMPKKWLSAQECSRLASLLLASTSYQKIYTLWPHIIVMIFGNPVSSQHPTGRSCPMMSWMWEVRSMSNSTKKAADQAEREKVKSDTQIEESRMLSIRQRSRSISTMPIFISVLRSMSEFQLIISVRKLPMNSRRTIMKSSSWSIPIGSL